MHDGAGMSSLKRTLPSVVHNTDSTARFSAMSGDAWSRNISHYYVIVLATTKLNAALMCGCLGLEIPL